MSLVISRIKFYSEGPRRARWKYRLYSGDALAERTRVRDLLTQSRELLKQMQVD